MHTTCMQISRDEVNQRNIDDYNNCMEARLTERSSKGKFLLTNRRTRKAAIAVDSAGPIRQKAFRSRSHKRSQREMHMATTKGYLRL